MLKFNLVNIYGGLKRVWENISCDVIVVCVGVVFDINLMNLRDFLGRIRVFFIRILLLFSYNFLKLQVSIGEMKLKSK